jgi:O-antigen ligase/DNA-binding XRE family transcriptional regulator
LSTGQWTDLGAKVSATRRDAGLSQKALADRLGVSLWAIDSIEQGRADAALHLPAIRRITGATAIDRFLPRDESLSTEDIRGSHLARDATGRGLVLGAIALLVLVRFFTEVVPVVPRAANFIDIPIFIVLAFAAMAKAHADQRHAQRSMGLMVPASSFLALCVLSALVNASRTQAAPVLVFVYGFLGPLGIYAAVYRLWPRGNALALSRLLVALGVVQLLVVFTIDLRHFIESGHNPDVISGTFGTNAYQLVFFLLVVLGLLAGIFTVEPQRRAARIAPILLVLILGTIFLAQYRALLATTAVTVLLIGALIGSRARGIVAAVMIGVALVVTLQYVATRFPNLKFASTVATLTQSPTFYAAERLGSARSVERLFSDHPRFIITGTGPGTFSSRAWQTFSSSQSNSGSNVQGAYASALTGGTAYHTDVSDKYVLPQLRSGAAIQGSDALTSPYSSYLSLMAEIGLFGFFLLAGIYLAATGRALRAAARSLRHRSAGDALPAVAIASAVAFAALLQMGLLGNWLEVTRLTFLSWTLFAVVEKESP